MENNNGMIQVVFGTNTNRTTSVVEATTTVREFLESKNFNNPNVTIHQDGIPLQGSMLDKTFAELGVTNKTWISAIQKADNAK